MQHRFGKIKHRIIDGEIVIKLKDLRTWIRGMEIGTIIMYCDTEQTINQRKGEQMMLRKLKGAIGDE